jgi:hypothetical protein
MADAPRRFPAPWRADKIAGGYVVRDANGQALAYVYSRDNQAEAMQAKTLTKDEARRIAINIARMGSKENDMGQNKRKPTARRKKPEPPVSVFVSYSRKDGPLVWQLIRLFAAVDVPVFRDEQSIKPGGKWRVEINAALEQCQVILVFWCKHARKSSEVSREYVRAVSLGKRVVPVLVDYTALPPDLGQYQGVDLRSILSGLHRRFRKRHGAVRHGVVDLRTILRRASQQLRSSLAAEFGEYCGILEAKGLK